MCAPDSVEGKLTICCFRLVCVSVEIYSIGFRSVTFELHTAELFAYLRLFGTSQGWGHVYRHSLAFANTVFCVSL